MSGYAHVRNGSIASVWPIAGYFRSSPNNGHGEAGFDPTPKPSPSAGALYDSVEGRQRWACVEAGEIKAMGYGERPADDWLPVQF